MTLFFPLLPHLQLPGSLFSHIPGPSISKQSQETQSGVLSFLRTFKHNMNSFPICLLMSVTVLCLCDIAFPLCELDAPRTCIVVSCPQGSPTLCLSSVQSSCSVVSNSLRPHEPQHARPPCPTPTPGVHSDSRRVSDAIQPSHPLSTPSPPAPNPSQHQSLFQ